MHFEVSTIQLGPCNSDAYTGNGKSFSFFFLFHVLSAWISRREYNKKLWASLCQLCADHICSTLIMTEEVGGDGFRHGFSPLPASCLHNAFLNPSQKLPSQTSLFITQSITILHCFVGPSSVMIRLNWTSPLGVTLASLGLTGRDGVQKF